MTGRFTWLDAFVLVAYLAGTTTLGLYLGAAAEREGLFRRGPRDSVVGSALLGGGQRERAP